MNGEYEYSVTVPSLYKEPNDDSVIVLHMSANGGGTVGESYANNSWIYSVEVNGTELIAGNDLRSNATPGTHASMARTLCSFLSAAGESYHWAESPNEYDSEYNQYQAEFLAAEYERFSMFADESEDSE